MTKHAPTDVHVLSVHTENGGCGVPHELGTDVRSIDCLPCEGWLDKNPKLGWANDPTKVKRTCDENAQAERDKDAAAAAGVATLNALSIGQQLGGGVPQALLDQMAAMQQQIAALMAQNAQLAAAAGSTPQAKGGVTELAPLVSEPEGGEAFVPGTSLSLVDDALAPPKRGGRPRKQTSASV